MREYLCIKKKKLIINRYKVHFWSLATGAVICKAWVLIWNLLWHVALERSNTYRQIFQLQLTNCVVRFDVLGDQGQLKVCIFKHSVSLLPVRPVLGALDLEVDTTQAERWRGYWGWRWGCRQKLKACGRRLTDPFSMTRFSITTPRLLCSHTISQKFPHVFGRGPWKRKAAV